MQIYLCLMTVKQSIFKEMNNNNTAKTSTEDQIVGLATPLNVTV